jgi:signal transduction histidine kinase
LADETRRRFERDLHDGAQQRFVAAALKLKNAQAAVPAGLPELTRELVGVKDELAAAIDQLRDFAQGIHRRSSRKAGSARRSASSPGSLRFRSPSTCRRTGGSPSRSRLPPSTSSPKR